MDHHNKFVGFIFAIMGAILVDSMSHIVFQIDELSKDVDMWPGAPDLNLKSHKLYWCSVFAIVLGLIQLITSALLTTKEGFLKIWSFIHIALALGYIVMFVILLVKIKDPAEDYWIEGQIFNSLLCRNFVLIIPVAAFNLTLKSRDYV